MIKNIIKLKLKWLAQLTLWRYRPKIIAVTGSVGKTSTKNAIYTIISKQLPAWSSYKSYNNQIGLPLTILGFNTPGKNIWGWFKIILYSIGRLFYRASYPKVLVLEMGSDRIGDINYLTGIAKPDIAVLTSIGSSHMEHFGSRENLIKEKASLITNMKAGGVVVLNIDDLILKKIGLEIDKEVVFYGQDKEATFRAEEIHQSKNGLTFKAEALGNSVPIRTKALGSHQVYNMLAALAVGSLFDFNLVEMSQALNHYRGEKGRLKLLPGKKETTIIDDSYNSAPESAKKALETLSQITDEGERKVAVIGDMLELGEGSDQAHQEIGQETAKVADLSIFVGGQNDQLARGAKMAKTDSQIMIFSDYQSLNKKLLSIINKGDIVLVKGSQGVRLDKVVRKLLSKEVDPDEVLVRQTEEWKE